MVYGLYSRIQQVMTSTYVGKNGSRVLGIITIILCVEENEVPCTAPCLVPLFPSAACARKCGLTRVPELWLV